MAHGYDGDSQYLRLSQRISENNFLLQDLNSDLRRVIRIIGTDREQANTASMIRDMSDQAHNLIKETSSMLNQMNQLDGGNMRDSRARQNQHDKLALDLEQLVKEFKNLQGEALRKERESVERDRAASMYHDEREDASLLDGQQHQEQVEIRARQEYIREREEALAEIESQMIEINEIFHDLAEMVHDQGEMIDNMANHVVSASHNAEQAVVNLEGANRYQKSKRKKMTCVLVLFVIVAAVLAIILATTIK